MADFISNIKLVIWDLDDTFWEGTLSEGPVNPIYENIQLVKELSSSGILNSICSKNSEKPVIDKLKELQVYDYFVFSSIDWQPKGQRISQMLKKMGLRATNVLFIDDNIQNLNEAKYYEPDLNLMTPDRLGELIGSVRTLPKQDVSLKRLKQYKILEQKQLKKAEASSNIDFLYSTNTKVNIKYDCINQFDRIYELVHRTNQLNFTKNRSSREELFNMINDPLYTTGYVEVSDCFGDYGIVGFFSVHEHKCEHFLFSCRTIGQGVEQYVYSYLGYPDITIIGEVVNIVDQSPAPPWINNYNNDKATNASHALSKSKIIIKGACDLDILFSYLSSENIITEFTYIGEKHNRIEHHNHSVNILEWANISLEDKMMLVDTCLFNDKDMFQTSIFDSEVELIFLSTQIEPNLAIYKNKNNGIKLAFGEWCYPLTDRNYWSDYIMGNVPNYGNKFTIEWLEKFSSEWSYEGRIDVKQYISNLECLLGRISPKAKLCLLLGSEIPYLKNTQKAYVDRHLIYKDFNASLREFADNNDRVLLLPFGDFIKGQDDFLDNINHYQRRVYYEAAQLACNYINSLTDTCSVSKSKYTLILDNISQTIKSLFKSDSIVYRFMRHLYHTVRK